MKQYYVYIVTNKPNGVLYIGITNNLERRHFEHERHQNPNSFSAEYNTSMLVYFEETSDIHAALKREKQLKNWHRTWKINLIESTNPTWNNLLESGNNKILKQVQDDRENT